MTERILIFDYESGELDRAEQEKKRIESVKRFVEKGDTYMTVHDIFFIQVLALSLF